MGSKTQPTTINEKSDQKLAENFQTNNVVNRGAAPSDDSNAQN